MGAISETGPETRNPIARLWRDKETRSVIIQIVTLVVILTAIALILRNVVINLEAVGKEFSFGFFFYPAGYDITFSPFIEYSSRSTHLKAAAVGLLNTLLVAACGIVLATIMGFTMGVLRLSSNWIVNRMVYCFLEFTRNIPVLLHILFIYGLVVELLPVPKQAVNFADSFFLTNRGFFIPQPVWEPGAGIVAAAFVISIAFVVFFIRWAKKTQDETGRIYPVSGYRPARSWGRRRSLSLPRACRLPGLFPSLGGSISRAGWRSSPSSSRCGSRFPITHPALSRRSSVPA